MNDAWYATLVLRRPAVPLLAAAVLGAAACLILPGFRVDAHGDSLTLEHDPDRAAYDRVRQEFGGDDELIVGIDPREPWTPATLARIDALAAELEALDAVPLPDGSSAPGLDRVLSPTRIRLFRSLPPGTPALFAVRPVTVLSPNVDLERARDELTASALVGGSLVARDGRAFAIAARLAPPSPADEARRAAPWVDRDRDARQERLRAVVRAVRAVAARHEAPGFAIHVSGVPAVVVDMVDVLRRDMTVFGAAAALVMALLLAVALRRAAWVALPLATVALLVALVLAGTVLAGRRATVVTANLSALLVVIGLAHAVHLAVRLAEVRAAFPAAPLAEAVRRSVREVARPCLYAALTTSIGFGSIAVSDIRPNVDFGIAMAAGALLAWLLTFLVIPPALLLLPERHALPGAPGTDRRLLESLARVTLRRPRVVVVASLLLAAVAAAGTARLTVESRLTDHVRAGDPLARGLAFVDQRLGGTVPVEIVLRGTPGAFRRDDGIDAVRRVHELLEASPAIGATVSLEAVRREGTAAVAALVPFASGEIEFERLLSTSERLLGTERVREIVEPYVDETWATARIVARVKETAPGLDRRALLRRLREAAAETVAGTGFEAEVSGLFVLYANMLASLARSTLRAGLAVAVALLAMLALLFRDLRVGALALVPNVLPVLAVLGAMGLAGTPLDMMSIMTASVTLGLAVDASIHYTFGYLRERRAGAVPDAAIVRAQGGIGRAILHTSLIVVGGFLVLVFSRFVPTARFGVLTAFAVAAAVAASLVLLPVLLRHASGR